MALLGEQVTAAMMPHLLLLGDHFIRGKLAKHQAPKSLRYVSGCVKQIHKRSWGFAVAEAAFGRNFLCRCEMTGISQRLPFWRESRWNSMTTRESPLLAKPLFFLTNNTERLWPFLAMEFKAHWHSYHQRWWESLQRIRNDFKELNRGYFGFCF